MKISGTVLLCAALLCGCARGETSAATADASRGAALADQSQVRSGTGHLTLTGSESLSKDFKVSECRNEGPSPISFMGGYRMSGSAGDGSFSAGMAVSDFDKDGTYHPSLAREAAASKSIEKATQTMSTNGLVLSGNTSLNIALDSIGHTRPLYAGDKSTLVVTISNSGLDGTATFTNWLPLSKLDEARLYDEPVSGSMTWACDEVKRP